MHLLRNIFFVVVAGFAASTQAVEVNCDQDRVRVRDARIEVTPGTGDDTEIIQCALQEAARVGVRSVRLLAGSFAISELRVADFTGQFAGTGRSKTQLNIGVPCPASDDDKKLAGAVTFENGNVEVRNMTVVRSGNCASSYDALFWFTGDPDNCDKRTVFANVDRVDVASLPNEDDTAVIEVSRPAECSDSSTAMTGSLRVNRLNYVSSGDNAGIFASMVGNADITVTNSKIDSTNCLTLIGQSTAAVTMRDNECKFSQYAVSASLDTNEQTQFSLKDNTFVATKSTVNTAVDLSASSGKHTVTGNTIESGEGNGSTAANGLMGLSDAYVAGNIFRGAAIHAITVGDGTVMVDNNLELTSADGDINSYTPGCPDGLVIGPQGATFSDQFCSGNDAIIGEQTVSP